MIPTMELRFVEREVPVRLMDENTWLMGNEKVLQQLWRDGHSRPSEWRDVPLVGPDTAA